MKNKYDIMKSKILNAKNQQFVDSLRFTCNRKLEAIEREFLIMSATYPALIHQSHFVYECHEALQNLTYSDVASVMHHNAESALTALVKESDNYRIAMQFLYLDAVGKECGVPFWPIPTDELEHAREAGIPFSVFYDLRQKQFYNTVSVPVANKCFRASFRVEELSVEEKALIRKHHKDYMNEEIYPSVETQETSTKEDVHALRLVKSFIM